MVMHIICIICHHIYILCIISIIYYIYTYIYILIIMGVISQPMEVIIMVLSCCNPNYTPKLQEDLIFWVVKAMLSAFHFPLHGDMGAEQNLTNTPIKIGCHVEVQWLVKQSVKQTMINCLISHYKSLSKTLVVFLQLPIFLAATFGPKETRISTTLQHASSYQDCGKTDL